MTELPRGLKIATVWLLLGTLVFVGVQALLHERERTRFVVEGGVVEIQRGADGHYHWPGTIDGVAVDFLVDTGATRTAIPLALAGRLQLRSLGREAARTAGGTVVGRIVRIDVVLQGGVRAERLQVAALPELHAPLLGMDVLGRLRWRQQDGVLHIDAQSPG